MRAKLIINGVLLASLAVIFVLWLIERRTGTALQRLHAVSLAEQREGHELSAERDRLRAAVLNASRERGPAATASVTAPSVPAGSSSVPVFPPGEWVPAKTWQNEGRHTVRAALDTVLWAAAGGDLAVFTSALEIDAATRTKLNEAFQNLPPAARSLYATPEDMLASVAMKAIPPTAAQISWFNQIDADHATVGLMIANPDPAKAAKFTVLSLRQTTDGWRIRVPDAAIQRLTAPTR